MLREEQIDIRRQRAKAGQVPDRERRQEPRVLRLPRHQPGVRRAVHRLRPRVRHRRQRLHLPGLQGQHARHLQAHRSGSRSPEGRPARRTSRRRKRPSPGRKSSSTTASNCNSAFTCRRDTPTSSPDSRRAYFDEKGLWTGRGRYEDLIRDIEAVPEEVTVMSDALEFVDREIERAEMLAREAEWLKQLEAGTLDLNLLPVPLYDYQVRGALFLACRGRSILGDDMGLGKTIQTLAAVELLARERGIQRVLVVAPASVKYQWETEIRKFTDAAGAGHRRQPGGAARPVRRADLLPARQLRTGGARPRSHQRLEARRGRFSTRPSGSRTGRRRRAGR